MIHTDLPIYKSARELVSVAVKVQVALPRAVRRALGDMIMHHCMQMLDGMARANATREGTRAMHIESVLMHHRAATVMLRVCFDNRYISHDLWAQSVQLLETIGKQAGGWLKKTYAVPVA